MILKDLEKEIWSKESHKGKKLAEHIEECKKLTLDFLDFYNLTDYKEFAELLCYYHDLGKLKPTWSVENENNPPHSPFSFLILLKDKEKLNKYPLLGLFVLKHHATLTGIEDSDIIRVNNEAPANEKEKIDKETKSWRSNLYKYVTKFDTTLKIDLVDTYGLFKFADILSANNLTNYKISNPNKNVEDLKSWALGKIQKKGLKVRNKDFQIQLSLSKINNNLLIRAPTGWGKTFASLSYAVGKNSKIIYVLPTIASIKNFYDDLCTFFGKKILENFSIMLMLRR